MANGKQIKPIGQLTFVPMPQEEGFGKMGSQLFIDESGQYFTKNKASGNVSPLTGEGAINEEIRRQYNYDWEVANTTAMPTSPSPGPESAGTLGPAGEYVPGMGWNVPDPEGAFLKESMEEVVQENYGFTPDPEASPTNDQSSIDWFNMPRWRESIGDVTSNYLTDFPNKGIDQLQQVNETIGFPAFSAPWLRDKYQSITNSGTNVAQGVVPPGSGGIPEVIKDVVKMHPLGKSALTGIQGLGLDSAMNSIFTKLGEINNMLGEGASELLQNFNISPGNQTNDDRKYPY